MNYLERLDQLDPDDYHDRRQQEIDFVIWDYGSWVPSQEWIRTQYMTWERNPHFIGPPSPQPEE